MITLQSYSGEIDGNQETVMRAIVDSVRFGQAAAENGGVTSPAVQGDSSTPTEGDGSETTNSDSSEATEGDSSAPGESDSAAAADSDGLSQGSFGSMSNLFFGLLFTAAVYSLPIVIYRFAIAKHPVEKASAKRITIVYGIAAFVIMFGILFALNGSGAAGASIVFWSIVNYLVLTRGKATGTEPPAAEADEQREEQASAEAE